MGNSELQIHPQPHRVRKAGILGWGRTRWRKMREDRSPYSEIPPMIAGQPAASRPCRQLLSRRHRAHPAGSRESRSYSRPRPSRKKG
jgi:hypothetical protein